ncbi:MAG: phosphotransferase [Sphingobium sp.]
MTASNMANASIAPVREAHRFNEKALINWMSANIKDFSAPMTIGQFSGGQSNPTYKLTTPSRSYVLRRKPSGELLKGAHAVEREVQVLQALAKTDVPVPRVFGLCTDNAVIGTWFYLMEMVEGRIFWDATLPEVNKYDRPAYFDAMNAVLAKLHLVDYTQIGLGDYGRPGNYFARQIDRWSKQYFEDAVAGRDPSMDKLIEWLQVNIPTDEETALTHGDCRIDNIIFHPMEPRVLAVLDWELSTLGHPLADFAYNAMMYHMPSHIVAGLAGVDLVARNLPTEADYVAAYCARTGRDGIPNYPFYIAFNFFRLAAIFHGIKGRVIRGNASSAKAAEKAEAFPQLAQIGFELTRHN